MGKVTFSIAASLDGYVAGPDQSREAGLGRGGEALHAWILGLESWRTSHGMDGGVGGVDSDVLAEGVERQGAVVMGRGMFGGGGGPWDPGWIGWWGQDPPFGVQVFVLTHHPRDPLALGRTTFTFVTTGIADAVAQARDAAGSKDVHIAGGAQTIDQALAAGLVDEGQVHVVPVLLGGGARLFADLGPRPPRLEQDRVLVGEGVTHLRYRVLR